MVPSDIELLVKQCVLNELGAMLLYTRLANRLESPEAQRIVRMLAAAEEGHIGKLTELVTLLGDAGTNALTKIGFVKALREEAGKRLEEQLASVGLAADADADALLQFAITTETRAGDHYERAAAQATDPRLREFFTTLVDEEAGHAKQLDAVLQMLRASSSPRG